jgi:site-specific recombinase XerD
VVEWFDEPMAVKLILANLNTLQKLCDRIRAKGYRWWVGVRQVGEIQGGKITRWLAQHEDTLGSLGEHALSPIRSVQKEIKRVAETGIVPIEAFSPPSILDGSSGTNRLPGKSRIQSNNDHQAIMAWLSARAPNEHTKRSYRREAERLLLWAILERGKALSSLDIEDGASYREWLTALGRTSKENWYWRIPQERWIGKRNTPRWSPEWRPFEGALSLNSQRQTYTILKSMFEWLVKVRYVDSNPFDGVSRPSHDTGDTAPHIEMGRAFTRGQWTFIMEYLDGLEMGDKVARLRFLLPFAYATGLRLSELADARTGRLYSKPMKDGLGVRWMLNVLGKGQKWRVVPMPSSVMSELGKYLAWRGLSEIPSENPPDTPLIAPLQDNKSRYLSHGMLYKILKSFFLEVAAELERRGHVEDAKNIAKASTHWLRHTRGSHSAESMPLNLVQRLLGHASLTTTSIYTSVDEEALYEAMEQELKKTKSGV